MTSFVEFLRLLKKVLLSERAHADESAVASREDDAAAPIRYLGDPRDAYLA